MPSVDDMELNNHVAIGLAESVDVNAAWLTPFRPQSHKNPVGKAAAHQQRDKSEIDTFFMGNGKTYLPTL